MKDCLDRVGLWLCLCWLAFMGVLGLELMSSCLCSKHLIEWPAQLRSFAYLSVRVKQLHFTTEVIEFCLLVLCTHTQQ